MRFSVYQVSRKGGRQKNEDRMGYCYTRSAGLFALTDGMGGHPEGEVAAQLALETVAAVFQEQAKPSLIEPSVFLREAVFRGHETLLRYGASKRLSDSPRTTFVGCVLQDGALHWAHCGDSRLYVVRENQIIVRTRDHSYRELQDALEQSAAPGQKFNRNMLFTCLGSPTPPVVDVGGPMPLWRGDRVLLCSDGLWGSVEDEDIVRILGDGTVADTVPELAEQALRAAGPRSDNVTVLALEWEGADDEQPTLSGAAGLRGDASFSTTITASLNELPLPGDRALEDPAAGIADDAGPRSPARPSWRQP